VIGLNSARTLCPATRAFGLDLAAPREEPASRFRKENAYALAGKMIAQYDSVNRWSQAAQDITVALADAMNRRHPSGQGAAWAKMTTWRNSGTQACPGGTPYSFGGFGQPGGSGFGGRKRKRRTN